MRMLVGTLLAASVLRLAWFSAECRRCFLLFFGLFVVFGLHARPIEIHGRAYLDLAEIAGHLGMKSGWLEGGDIYRLHSRWTTMDVKKQSRLLHLNRMLVYTGFPTVELKGRLYLSRADCQHVIQPLLTPQVFPKRPRLKRILLDAGHGGKDHGAENKTFGLKEKDLALDMVNRLRSLLERKGFDVVLTRETDHYIPLSERPQRADLFLSIHFNAAGSKNAAGFEVFALTPQHQASSGSVRPSSHDNMQHPGNEQDPWNILLAYHVQSRLVQRLGGPDRGVKRARFSVLKALDCPGVLVELGFLSHAQTAEKLRSSAYRDLLAQGLLEGILSYHEQLAHL